MEKITPRIITIAEPFTPLLLSFQVAALATLIATVIGVALDVADAATGLAPVMVTLR